MLTGKEIIRRHEIGDIVIDPFDEKRINPNSYNITLNKKLLVYKDAMNVEDMVMYNELSSMSNLSDNEEAILQQLKNLRILDIKKENPTTEIIIPEDGLILIPNRLYLGSTNEYTETYNLIPAIDGRSSIGRFGIDIHATAGFGDNGFIGVWTLEISVKQPVIIYPDIEIGQLYYELPDGDTSITYNGRYQNSREAVASRFHIK